ncbi:MAG: ATP synthase F0 subunit C [Clostridia bacterium]|nr:ATP synthase F0 subunit C [Clostridia bacterium]MBQ8828113.1 ATP synthase F0 subunit C [Clostridia bacterium]
MKKNIKRIFMLIMLIGIIYTLAMPVFAAAETADVANSALGDKAIAAAIAVGLAAAGGAIGMGWAIAKSAEGISRQPEAENKIRTTLMLGLVFVETAIIYALVIAILIIFVL